MRNARRWTIAAIAAAGLGAVAVQVTVIATGGSHPGSAPPSTAGSSSTASGAGSQAPSSTASRVAAPQPAAPAFAPLITAGEPPSDVLAAVFLPSGATVTRTENLDRQSGGVDRAIDLATDLSAGDIVAFYRDLLPRHGWSSVGVYPVTTGSGQEVLARHPGSDGFYWEIGVIVPAPGPSGGSAATGPAHPGTTTFQLRVERVEDEG